MSLALVQDPDPRVGKSQFLRVWDVFVLAPAMIAVGVMISRGKRVSRWVGPLAITGGIAVAVYNGRNYIRLRRGRASE